MDIGEVVTELAEAERQVNHQDVPQERQPKTDRRQQVVHQCHDHHGRQRDHAPSEDGIATKAGVEPFFCPRSQCAHDVVDRVVPAERTELFENQRAEYGEESHWKGVAKAWITP